MDAFIGIEAVIGMGLVMAMYFAHKDNKKYSMKYTSRAWKQGSEGRKKKK